MESITNLVLPHDTADRKLMLLSFLLALLFFFLFIPFRLGVNVPIFVTCVYAAAFFYQKQANAPADKGSISLFLIVMIASLPFILYDVSPFRVLHFFILLGALCFQLFTMFGSRNHSLMSERWLIDLGNAVLTPFVNADAFFRILFGRFKESRFRTFFFVALGFAVAIPLLSWLIWQFAAADAGLDLIFTKLNHFARASGSQVIMALLTAIPVAACIFGLFYGIRYQRRSGLLKASGKRSIGVLPSELIITALTLICAVQIFYIISQLSFFFTRLSGLNSEPYTYAEYARQGFLELCGVSLLNLMVITSVRLFTHYKKRRPKQIVYAFIVILCICSLAMISIALAKMLLYMRSFGLTANRLITSWFMLGLALVFIYSLIHCFRPGFKIIRATTVTAIAMFLMLCFIDCDYIAVDYNKNAYLNGQLEGFDMVMLYGASDSVIPVVIDLYENAEGGLKEEAYALLARYGASERLSHWRSFNIARYDAHNKFELWQASMVSQDTQ